MDWHLCCVSICADRDSDSSGSSSATKAISGSAKYVYYRLQKEHEDRIRPRISRPKLPGALQTSGLVHGARYHSHRSPIPWSDRSATFTARVLSTHGHSDQLSCLL